MATRPDPDVDYDFSEIYKEYTGPPSSTVNNAHDREKVNKRSLVDYDEEEETPDPNAVPTDFTSREAKFWEAKSKATERNWKKRKEEEIICKICGESGHFTQWSEELQKLDFQELVMFLQHLPTENWTHQELEMVLSRAFMGHSMFNNSPSHLAS